MDDTAPAGGSARFQVLGDGAVLFDSGLRSDSDPALFTGRIDVRGVRELLLVTMDGDDGYLADYADWGNPILVSTSAPPVFDGAALRRVRGRWEPEMSWPVQPVHATLLSTGEILSHAGAAIQGGGDPSPGANHDTTRVVLSNSGTFAHTSVDHPTDELFGAGHGRLADGSLVRLGGETARLLSPKRCGASAAAAATRKAPNLDE